MNCIICDSLRLSETIWGGYSFKGQKYAIIRCANCGFMFLNPFPDRSILDEIYKGDSYFDNYYAASTGIKNYIEGMMDCNVQHGRVIDLIKNYKKNGSLLDIGCAAGGFLLNAKNSGYDIYGIEPSKRMADYARDKLGLNVICGTLDDIKALGKSFDVIHAGDVLEHLINLKKDMEIIKNLLSHNGILVINQPLSYNRSFYNLFLKINMFFKKNRYSQNPPTHLWEFNSSTIVKFLENAGFAIIYCNIFETKPKPLAVHGKFGIKDIIGYWVKNISSFISSSFLFKRLLLGDRAVIICTKK